RSAFARPEERQASASVIVTLSPGARLGSSNARAIVYMVSKAVRGLDPKDVSVVDNHGNLIEGEKGDETVTKASTFMEHQLSIEREMTIKIEKLLEPMLGPDNYRVQVAVELQHIQKTTEQKTVDRDSKVPIHESMTSKQSDTGRATAMPASNGIPASVGRNGGSTKEMTEEIQYAFDSARSVVVETPGKPVQISVATVVNLPGDTSDPQVTQQRLGELTELIRSTVGATRTQDVVTVRNVPFLDVAQKESPLDEQTTTEFFLELGKRLSLGLLVIGALAALWISTAPRRREAKAQARLAAASTKAMEAQAQAALEGPKQAALEGQYTSDGKLLEYDETEYDENDNSPEAVAARNRRRKGDEEEEIDFDDLPEDAPVARKVAVLMKTKPERVKQLFRSWVESGAEEVE
ncbi:MAG: flagellar M-ring protein FliF C-terminal domain-containing protein, partial [Planctomycetota bacterium]